VPAVAKRSAFFNLAQRRRDAVSRDLVEDDNDARPGEGLRMQSPREYRRAQRKDSMVSSSEATARIADAGLY